MFPFSFGNYVFPFLNQTYVGRFAKAITEKRHKKIYFHGRDTWKKELAGALDKSAVSTEVLQRAGSRLASTEEWQPTRSRKNALSLSYTLPASFSTIA